MKIVMPLAEPQRRLADAAPPPSVRAAARSVARPVIRPADEGARLIAQLDRTQIGKAVDYWSHAPR